MMKSISVRALIAQLENEDPDAQVIFASNYGNRGCTQQAHSIKGELQEVILRESRYSDSGWAVDEEGGGAEEPTVLLLS